MISGLSCALAELLTILRRGHAPGRVSALSRVFRAFAVGSIYVAPAAYLRDYTADKTCAELRRTYRWPVYPTLSLNYGASYISISIAAMYYSIWSTMPYYLGMRMLGV